MAYHSLTVQRAGRLQKHSFELLGRRQVLRAGLPELERVENLCRVAVDHERLARLDLEPSASRQPGRVHTHHGGRRQRQRVQVAPHLGVNGLLHIVGLLHRAATEQAVRHRVVLIGQNWSVLHHVRVFFRLEQHPAVGDDHNGFHHVGVVLCRRIIGEKLHHLGVFVGQVLFWHQAVVGQQQHLLVLVLAHFLSRLQIGVFIRRGDVDLAIDALFDALDHFVD